MLTDAALKALKPKEKIYKIADRDGMYVRVMPSGVIVDCRQDLTRDCHREVTRLDDSFPRSGDGQVVGLSFRVLGAAALARKRKLSLPVSRIWQ